MAQQITSRSITELLLRQHVDDNLLDRLLSVLPMNEDDPNFKKALLLRRIQTEVTNATVSEKLLELLELVGELDFRQGTVPSEAMKSAYCAVAVDCTVRFLGLDDENVKYFETLKSLWDVRVGKIVKSENPGLISDRLWCWRDDLEAATSDSELCDMILSRNTRNEALKAVEGYLTQAWDEIYEAEEEQCFEGPENVIIIPSDSPCEAIGPSVRLKSAENVVKMWKAGYEIHEPEEEQCLEGSENVIIIPSDSPCDERGPLVRLKSAENVVKMWKAGYEIHEFEEEQSLEGSKNVIIIPSDSPCDERGPSVGLKSAGNE